MQQLVLVPKAHAITDETLERYAVRKDFQYGWRSEVATLLDAPGLATAAPAEVARHSIVLPAGLGTSACFASPVHVHIGRYGGRLAEPGALTIGPDDSLKFEAAFAAAFDPADCELRALPDGGFLALVPNLPSVTTVDPDECLTEPVDTCLPSGPGAPRLRQLSTEIEMWLHTLTLNHARASSGLPPISGLWLWGCGNAAPGRDATVGTERSLAVYSRDSFLLGAGSLLNAVVSEQGAITMNSILGRHVDRVVADADDSLIAAAIAAVRSGRVGKLDVVLRHALLSLRRRDLLKFWRRRPRAALIP